MNLARSLGADAVVGSFQGYHWIYWLGPALGGGPAMAVYYILKAVNFETCSPEQDMEKEPEPCDCPRCRR